MQTYILTVVRRERDEQTEAELKDHKMRMGGIMNLDRIERPMYKEDQVLFMEVSEKTLDSIREAMLKSI